MARGRPPLIREAGARVPVTTDYVPPLRRQVGMMDIVGNDGGENATLTMVPALQGREHRPCGRCEILPPPLPERATLFLAPPLSHTAGTVRRVLRETGAAVDTGDDGLLRVDLAPGDLHPVLDALLVRLTAAEQTDTRTLLVAAGETPDIHDIVRARSLRALAATARADWLVDLLRDERLTTHLQPIVRATAPAEIFGYECLMRGLAPDGELIPPGTLYTAATDANLLFQLDLAARLGAIRSAHRQAITTRIFSIYDPAFCLRSTVRAIEAAGIPPEQVVFEAVESEEVRDTGHLLNVLSYYREAGFQVALDDLGSGYGSLALLTQLRPDFVKLDIALIRGVDQDPFKAILASKLLEAAHACGIQTVAEGVETSGEWRWLRDHGADLVQGFLFARPGDPAPVPIVPE